MLLTATLASALSSEEIISHVNGGRHGWVAGVNKMFANRTKEQIQKLLGTRPQPRGKPSHPPAPGFSPRPKAGLPPAFDSRTQWPRCPSIGYIWDQGECGSCWAFSAVGVFTDRYCIVAKSASNPFFSPQYLVTCDDSDNGCQGGNLASAWSFLQSSGLPLQSCQPYTVPTCPPADQPCLNFVDTPMCAGQTCPGNGTWAATLSNTPYSPGCGWTSCSAADMATDIQTNGPIQVTMTVYEDFVHYKSGVYRHTTGDALGGHAIRIVGWGVENGDPYWLIANSWTTAWGDGGYFKILRGSDESGIEDDTAAGNPIINM